MTREILDVFGSTENIVIQFKNISKLLKNIFMSGSEGRGDGLVWREHGGHGAEQHGVQRAGPPPLQRLQLQGGRGQRRGAEQGERPELLHDHAARGELGLVQRGHVTPVLTSDWSRCRAGSLPSPLRTTRAGPPSTWPGSRRTPPRCTGSSWDTLSRTGQEELRLFISSISRYCDAKIEELFLM